MAAIEKAESTAQGLRQIIQDLVAPEMRELKAEVRNTNARLDRLDARLDRLKQIVMAGFEGVRRQLDTYQEVQAVKERLARIEGERSPKPAA